MASYSGRLKWLERFAYINTTIYPITVVIPLLAYCSLPVVCLLTGKFIVPQISNITSIWFISLFLSIFATGILEINEMEWCWDRRMVEKLAVLGHWRCVSSSFCCLPRPAESPCWDRYTVTSKSSGEDGDFADLYMFKWTTLLIPPTTLLIINLVGVVAGVFYAINSGYQSWVPLSRKLFFAFWVIIHLYPFLKGLMGRQNRTPTIIVVWSVLLASIFSLLWVRVDPFTAKVTGPDVEQCGINC